MHKHILFVERTNGFGVNNMKKKNNFFKSNIDTEIKS